MRIEYQEFGASVVVFLPTREERKVLLECLKVAKAQFEDPVNLEVFDYFIGQIEAELSQPTQ